MEMQALRKEIMGVSFDDLTLEEAVRRGAELAAGPGRWAWGSGAAFDSGEPF